MLFVRRHYNLLLLATLIGVPAAIVARGQKNEPANTDTASESAAITSNRKAYALKYKSPEEVLPVLRPLVGKGEDVELRADAKGRTIVVRGPDWVHQCTRQVLETLDKPADRSDTRASVEKTVAYQCREADRETVELRIRKKYPAQEVAVSGEPSSEIVFIRAPERTHRELRTWLEPIAARESGRPPESEGTGRERSPGRKATAASPNAAADANAPRRKYVTVVADQTTAVRRALFQLLDGRIEAGSDDDSFLVTTASGNAAIRIDTRHEEFVVEGPITVVDQLSRLIDALARNRSSTGRVQVVPLKRDTQPRLREFIGPNPDTAPAPEPDSQGARRRGVDRRVQPVAYQQNSTLPAPQNAGEPTGNEDDPERKDGPPRLAQFEGVEMEMLPDLDAIILRGRDQELKQLAEIIQQLEKISRETQAVIEIVPLKFASSQRVATLITQTQTQLIGNRQGRATATALVKPNAMLLIGWGEAVKAIAELIEKLDQPVDPETTFDIVRLKHANATTVQTSLQTFYATRTALGTIIQSTADLRTNSIIVHASPRDLAEVRALIERLDVPQGATVQRTRVFPIQNSLAADVAQTLQQAIQPTTPAGRSAAMELMLENGQGVVASGILENTQITINARNNSLIISAPAANFELIENLIRQLDVPGMVAKIKIFPIANGDAVTLVETLRSLLPSQTGTTQGPQLSSAPGESSLAPLRFTVDSRSNSLIATGSEGDLKIVEALIVRLDESDSMQRRSLVYQLRNAAAVDVALTINDFLRANRQLETAGPNRISPFQQLEKEVIVVPEPVANKLILSATPRYFDEISKLIEKLDEQPPQVMIQVLIAEVALGDSEEFGVELGIQDSVLFDRSLLGNLISTTNTNQASTPSGIVTSTQQTVVAASNTPGFDFNNVNPLGNSGSAKSLGTAGAVGGQGLSNFDVGRGNAELGFGGLVLSASSQNLSVLMRALQESKRLDVLSRPQVLTLDNQPAFIQVGQRVPRIVGSAVNQVGQQNNITLENVGLILGVTPRISPDGNVVMEIDAEKSELGAEDEGIPVSVSTNGTVIRSPRINTTTAQATVSAANGETIILGGLITKSMRQLHRKVPFLGDVPLLGNLFRFDSQSERRTELLIILTPNIVRTQEDMERLKQTEVSRMSWCAADVFDIHGDLGLGPQLGSNLPESEGLEVVYPDVDPRGRLRERRTNRSQGMFHSQAPARESPTAAPRGGIRAGSPIAGPPIAGPPVAGPPVAGASINNDDHVHPAAAEYLPVTPPDQRSLRNRNIGNEGYQPYGYREVPYDRRVTPANRWQETVAPGSMPPGTIPSGAMTPGNGIPGSPTPAQPAPLQGAER